VIFSFHYQTVIFRRSIPMFPKNLGFWKAFRTRAGFLTWLGLMVFLAFLIPGLAHTPAAAQSVTATPTPTLPVTVTPVPGAPAFQRTISVNGAGTAQATPDMATVILGVQTDAATATDALAQNNQKMQALINSLKSSDILAADIQTVTVQLYPRYDQSQPTQGSTTNQVVGYTAANIVQVTIRKLNTLGEVLDAAVKAGGNTVQSINFDLSDKTTALDQARQAAVADARHKAEQLAKLTNASLGPIVTITDTSVSPIPYQAAAGSAMAQPNMAVPVSPGTQTINANIQVTWELIPTTQ
jgi:uncharacterized protein